MASGNSQPGGQAQSPRPLTVGVVIFDDVEVLDFAGPFEVFSVAGRQGSPNPDEVVMKAFTIAQSDQVVHARGNLLIQPHFTFENHPPLDVLVVPGGFGTRREIDNPVMIDWLSKVSATPSLRTSVCTGSFLLGKIGLFDGRKATTHWASLDRMEETFPKVQVIRDVRWVDEGDVVSSAGISAGIDMSLHVVERLLGREVAEKTARNMEYFWNEQASVAASQ